MGGGARGVTSPARALCDQSKCSSGSVGARTAICNPLWSWKRALDEKRTRVAEVVVHNMRQFEHRVQLTRRSIIGAWPPRLTCPQPLSLMVQLCCIVICHQ